MRCFPARKLYSKKVMYTIGISCNLRDKGFKPMASPNRVKFVAVALISICESRLPDERDSDLLTLSQMKHSSYDAASFYFRLCVLFLCEPAVH